MKRFFIGCFLVVLLAACGSAPSTEVGAKASQIGVVTVYASPT